MCFLLQAVNLFPVIIRTAVNLAVVVAVIHRSTGINHIDESWLLRDGPFINKGNGIILVSSMAHLILISLEIFTMLMLTCDMFWYHLMYCGVKIPLPKWAREVVWSLLAADLLKNSCQNAYHKLFRHMPVLHISILKGGDIRTLNLERFYFFFKVIMSYPWAGLNPTLAKTSCDHFKLVNCCCSCNFFFPPPNVWDDCGGNQSSVTCG